MEGDFKRKSGFGGTVGAEFDAIWEAIQRNKVIGAPNQRVSKTTNGTIIEPLSEESESVTTTSQTSNADGLQLLRVATSPIAPFVGTNSSGGTLIKPWEYGEGAFVNVAANSYGMASYQQIGNDPNAVIFHPPPIHLATCQQYSAPQDSVYATSLPNPTQTGYSAAKGHWYLPNPEYYHTNGTSTAWRLNPNYVVGEIIMVRDLAVIVPSYQYVTNQMTLLHHHDADWVTAGVLGGIVGGIWKWT